MKKYILPFIISLLLQLFISNLISVRGFKPDFIILFLVYFALDQDSFKAVVFGFIIGIIVSFFDNSSLFGILPLTYSIIGYGTGLLSKYKRKMTPIKFNVLIYTVFFISFIFYSYFLFGTILYNDFWLFLFLWFKNLLYTLILLVILQIIIPLNK